MAWIGSESTCPQCFSQQGCMQGYHAEHNACGPDRGFIYQNLPDLCALQSGLWVKLCSWPSCLWEEWSLTESFHSALFF